MARSKRLKAIPRTWLDAHERHDATLSDEIRERLLAMSPSTMDRFLAPVRARRRKGLSASGGGARRLEGQIPIRTRFQEVEGTGLDRGRHTVAHCGTSPAGAFVWSLTLTGIWSGWTGNRAVWNRSKKAIVAGVRDVERSLAFDIEGFDSDNGREFLNYELYRSFRERPVPVEFTRSRPYRKNDNAHVTPRHLPRGQETNPYDGSNSPGGLTSGSFFY